jgi:HEPN domain-containing protein
MNKEEHIRYWIDTAEKDWDIVNTLFEAGKYVYYLFFAHLVLEKLSKALWVKDNEPDIPPKIHNIVYLLEQTSVELTTEQKKIFAVMNDFQLEGRYPDYKQKIFQLLTKEKTDEILSKVKEMRGWLQKKLQ